MISNFPELSLDGIGMIASAVLTLCVFGYLLGDLGALGAVFKFFYRLALHVLIGAGAAYALLVAVWSVLYPRVFLRLWGGWDVTDVSVRARVIIAGFGTLLGVLLLFKLVPSLAWAGNIATGYLIGVGAGVAAGGAVIGTLYAQSQAAATFSGARNGLEGLVMALTTLLVFISFTFSAAGRKGPAKVWAQIVQALSKAGQVFMYVALGAAFAGVYVAGVSVLVGRVQAVAPVILAVLGRLIQ